ncbi:MAG: energy transducer TonB [Nannocystaceae bacterium]
MNEPREAEVQVRTVPALLSPFVPLKREFADILRNPLAFFGGIVGTLALGGALVAVFMINDAKADDEADDSLILDIDFNPGALVRQGEKIDPEQIPEKLIVEETVAAEPDDSSSDKVTTDEKAKPPPDQPKKTEKKDTTEKSTQKPDPNKKPGTKVSDKNRDSNTPYNDLPTVKDLPGDPFGSADGWADMAKDGDPWATGVVGALNKMKVPSYAAQQKSGVFQFQIEICANGTISRVTTKKSTGDGQLDKMLVAAVEATKIPLPPAEVAKQLKGGCKKIPYKFTWKNGGKVE